MADELFRTVQKNSEVARIQNALAEKDDDSGLTEYQRGAYDALDWLSGGNKDFPAAVLDDE